MSLTVGKQDEKSFLEVELGQYGTKALMSFLDSKYDFTLYKDGLKLGMGEVLGSLEIVPRDIIDSTGLKKTVQTDNIHEGQYQLKIKFLSHPVFDKLIFTVHCGKLISIYLVGDSYGDSVITSVRFYPDSRGSFVVERFATCKL